MSLPAFVVVNNAIPTFLISNQEAFDFSDDYFPALPEAERKLLTEECFANMLRVVRGGSNFCFSTELELSLHEELKRCPLIKGDIARIESWKNDKVLSGRKFSSVKEWLNCVDLLTERTDFPTFSYFNLARTIRILRDYMEFFGSEFTTSQDIDIENYLTEMIKNDFSEANKN